MNRLQRWVGWIAIGVGVLAVVMVVTGTSFGSQRADRFHRATMPQPSASQGNVSQGSASQAGRAAPGTNSAEGGSQQQGSEHQDRSNASGQDGQWHKERSGNESQQGSAAPSAPQGRSERRGDGSFRSWLRFPFKLLDGITQIVTLGFLVLVGIWLLGKRSAAPTASSVGSDIPQPPSQAQRSPTGETYTDEPSDQA